MKRLLALSLVFIFVLLSGCGTKENNSSMLEQSIGTDNVINTSSKQGFMDYVGTWSDSGISFEKGGFILDVSIDGKEMALDFSRVSSGPDSYTAELSENIALSDIKDSVASIDYEDDGWGNSGTVEITFSSSYILVDFKNVILDSMANWGFYESTYKLEKNEQAHSIITQGSNDYYEDNPIEITPVYDTSKASGILAEAGLTEEEFKNICTPLSTKTRLYYNNSNSTTVYNPDSYHLAEGKKYYSQNSSDTTVELATQKWNDICIDYESGDDKYEQSWSGGITWGSYHLFEKYKTLDNYLNDTVYSPKGQEILCDYTKSLFDEMLEYPEKHIGKPFVLVGFDITSDLGEVYIDDYYMESDVTVYDLRDNPNDPNILSENDYYFYVIFDGLSSEGGYYYRFSLITVEKIERWQPLT